MVIDRLFKVELIVVAVGWQMWVSLMVSVVLCKVELMVVARCRYHWWLVSCDVGIIDG